MKVAGTLLLSLVITSLVQVSAAPPHEARTIAGADRRSAEGTASSTRTTSTGIGACNPRVELCEGRDEDGTSDGGRDTPGSESRDRGWLSGIACNPRVRVCED